MPGLEDVLGALSRHDPLSRVIFMLSPNDRLDDATPLEALRKGQKDRWRTSRSPPQCSESMAPPSAGGPDVLEGPLEDLRERELPLITYSDVAYCVYGLNRNPRYFGKHRTSRFDDPFGEYGVMYVAVTPEGAFAETLLPRPGVLTPTTGVEGGSVPVSGAMIDAHPRR